MRILETVFSIVYEVFNALANLAWGIKEVCRIIREYRTPEETEDK